MRKILLVSTFLLSNPLVDLHAVPSRCPKIDDAMLKLDASQLSNGGEVALNGYRWQVTGGNLCNPSCEDRYQQALQPNVTTHASYTAQNGSASCAYKFMLNNDVIADLILATDDSMKLPEHSPQRWSEVPANPEKIMEKEEEGYRGDLRILME